MPIDNFPVFVTGADQGLIQLDAGDPNYTKRKYERKIRAFNTTIVPGQPSFLITRESWSLLSQGLHRDRSHTTVSWLKPNYEVYAFVFCVAFKQINNIKFGYFRVRSILKKIDDVGDSLHMPVFVEENNIAYVDLDTAIANQSKPVDKWQDCLRFINEDDFITNPAVKRLKDDIDNNVIKKPGDPFYSSSVIPDKLIDMDVSIVKNDGSIFGKYRIWDDLLVSKYHLKKDTLISLTWDDQSRTISFDFKINDEYATRIQCPQPPVCTTHVV